MFSDTGGYPPLVSGAYPCQSVCIPLPVCAYPQSLCAHHQSLCAYPVSRLSAECTTFTFVLIEISLCVYPCQFVHTLSLCAHPQSLCAYPVSRLSTKCATFTFVLIDISLWDTYTRQLLCAGLKDRPHRVGCHYLRPSFWHKVHLAPLIQQLEVQT